MSIMPNINDSELIVTHQGVWNIADGINMDCYVTKDKKRLMSLRGTARVMNIKGGGSKGLFRNLKAKYLKPYLSDHLQTWVNRASDGKLSKINAVYGPSFVPFDSNLFVDICKAYIEADNNNILNYNQSITARRLLGIMTAFAKIGIASVIDEITGYQEERESNEMQKLLSKYISSELLPWTKVFNDEFYIQLFRLKKWGKFQKSGQKMPQVVGYLTNDIIYERLPEKVLESLKNNTPKSEAGNNSAKLHQSLSKDIGLEHLKQHLLAVIVLMKSSEEYDHFLYLLDKVYQKKGQGRIRYFEH